MKILKNISTVSENPGVAGLSPPAHRHPPRTGQRRSSGRAAISRAGAAYTVRQVSVELIEGAGVLESYREDWSRLCANALEPNIMLDPAMALAALNHMDAGKRIRFVLVWDNTNMPRRLIGLFPMGEPGYRWGLPISCASAWTNVHTFLSTPLLDQTDASRAADGFFCWLKDNPAVPRVMVYPFLRRNAVWDVMQKTCATHDIRIDEFDRCQRAMLESTLDGEGYLRESLGRKRRKEYRRLRNRLGDHGAVHFEVAETKTAIHQAIERFLSLEARGWKGARGTAMKSTPAGRNYFVDTTSELVEDDRCRVGQLMLDEEIVASIVIVTSGKAAWIWKIAYDEEYAAYSPGVLLILELTNWLLDNPDIDVTDSCAMPDNPMINHIWRERYPLTDLLITVRRGWVSPAIIVRLETARRWLRARAKHVYNTYIRR